jgi:RNA polymerase primary sigma factor
MIDEELYGIYAEEAAHHLILARDDEYQLGMSVRAMQQARERLATECDPDARCALEAQIRQGQEARATLAAMNQRLVISIAARYRGMERLDLIQFGNEGLLRAIDKFDPTRGYKFSTYATWWIRQTVTRGIMEEGRAIRVPVHLGERIRRVRRAQEELVQARGESPTAQELADHMGLPLPKVEDALAVLHRVNTASLNEPLSNSDKGYVELGDFIADERQPEPGEQADSAQLAHLLDGALESLTAREHLVISMLYGIGGGKEYTLAEAGRRFGLTRERIRQIEADALKKLRHPRRSRALKPYY